MENKMSEQKLIKEEGFTHLRIVKEAEVGKAMLEIRNVGFYNDFEVLQGKEARDDLPEQDKEDFILYWRRK